MCIAYVSHTQITFEDAVAHVYHVSEQWALHIGLVAAVLGIAAVADIVPCVLLEPVVMELLGCEDVVECHLASQVGMLYAAGEFEELLAQGCRVDGISHIGRVVEKRCHESGVVGMAGCEVCIVGQCQ